MVKLKTIFIIFCISLLAATIVPAEEGKSFVYDAKEKRDPLWPLVGSSGNVITYDSNFMLSDLILEGIMSGSGAGGIAMINGNVVGVNDKVGQFVVVQIETNSVVLRKGDQLYTLRLKKEE